MHPDAPEVIHALLDIKGQVARKLELKACPHNGGCEERQQQEKTVEPKPFARGRV
jgi:hypothetical protein